MHRQVQGTNRSNLHYRALSLSLSLSLSVQDWLTVNQTAENYTLEEQRHTEGSVTFVGSTSPEATEQSKGSPLHKYWLRRVKDEHELYEEDCLTQREIESEIYNYMII